MRVQHLVLSCLLFSSTAMAKDVQFVGTVRQPIPQSIQATHGLKAAAAGTVQSIPRTVTLLKVQLSAKAQQAFKNRLASVTQMPYTPDESLFPRRIELGMGNVPVLDQGDHGTCVTFAVTAAVDAILGKGDYISQLCQLQLGQHIENNAYAPSGWDGSSGRFVLNQMNTFGIVNQQQQRRIGCGGLMEYPLLEELPGNTEMSLANYHQLSEDLAGQVDYTTILDEYQATVDTTDFNKKINDVKAALNNGDRVVFGVLLAQTEREPGLAGAVGKHHALYDSWILTPEIMAGEADVIGGHEMIITGYDDDAVVSDAEGNTYRGLFTVRNSWGTQVGDKGTFYMSYYYFKVFALEAHRIRNLSELNRA